MIAVRLEGRLGNQLFQYAFIYSAAKIIDTEFYLDKSIAEFHLSEYFEIERDKFYLFDWYLFSINGCKNIFRYHLKRKFYFYLKKIYNLKTVDVPNNSVPSNILKDLTDNTIYEGFFQSEEYFENDKSSIKKLFQIQKSHKNLFKHILSKIPHAKKYVTVHIRRGDYLELNYALDKEYYHDAIKKIHTDENYYIFISDDLDFIKNEFNYLSNKYVSDNSEIVDFQFLGFSDICILSNSSFSWWGAYLNNRTPQIFVPRNWFGVGKESPVNILPESWIKLD